MLQGIMKLVSQWILKVSQGITKDSQEGTQGMPNVAQGMLRKNLDIGDVYLNHSSRMLKRKL